MTPQVQIWVHLDSEENAASLAVKLQELIRSVRKDGKTAYGFVIWTQGEAVKDKLVKLAEDKKIEDIAICYLPDRQREAYLKLFKVELSDKLRNIVFVYRDKKLAADKQVVGCPDPAKVVVSTACRLSNCPIALKASTSLCRSIASAICSLPLLRSCCNSCWQGFVK
jgi:hypothetical protein